MNRVEQLAAELIERRAQEGQGLVRVENVHEGVAVARRLLDLGKAHWFRGQVVNYPKLMPSLYRPGVDFEKTEQAMLRFSAWVKGTPGMEEIAASADAMLAIAQHYGMPSPFIDFSTEPGVAGYFASAATSPTVPGTESCIFCLDTDEADGIWGIRKGTDPERVVVNVSNLWRLEAQGGVFVWCRYDDLNGPFPLDRILFPYTGAVPSPTVAQIYPTRESPLEARLTEYFQAEAILRGSVVFAEIKRHVPMQTLTFDEPSVRPEYFIEPPSRHVTWAESTIAPWLILERVVWSDIQDAPSLVLMTELDGEPDEEASRCESTILAALQSGRIVRTSSTTLRIETPSGDVTTRNTLAQTLQRVWDAMARLPWTDGQFALTLGRTMRCFLEAHRTRRDATLMARQVERTTMKRLLSTPLRVELGGQGNIHTWAWVDKDELLTAVRSDFNAILRPEEHHRILGDSFNTMMVSRAPAFLFDFFKLSELFAREMIPSQAVFYPAHPLFATPARVQIIGPE